MKALILLLLLKVPVTNYGIDLSRLHDTFGYGAVADNIVDYSDKWVVTVRSSDPKDGESVRDQVRQAGWQGRCYVVQYAPGSWQLAPGLDFGAVHVQRPAKADGTAVVVHTQVDFISVAKALRAADPSFHPADVPDLRVQPEPPPSGPSPWWNVVSLAVGAALGRLLSVGVRRGN